MLLGQPVRQLAYFVEDVRVAGARHSALYGSGPFIVMPNPVLPMRHRGVDAELYVTCAFGQWGTMQVELMQQNKSGPSVLRDLYPENTGRYGFHHMAIFVDEIEAAVSEFAKINLQECTRVFTPDGNVCVFIDAVGECGHFIEIYERTPYLVGMYETVAKAAVGFSGRDPVRDA
jgi:hypothetical protein